LLLLVVGHASCGHDRAKQSPNHLCLSYCLSMPQMTRQIQQLRRVPLSSRQELVQAAPGCPAPQEGVTTLLQPSLAATGACAGHIGRQSGSRSWPMRGAPHMACVLRTQTACPCCAECACPCCVPAVTKSQGVQRTQERRPRPRRSPHHQQQQAAAWMQRWVETAVVVASSNLQQVVKLCMSKHAAICASLLLCAHV
jgi:hypothetical protein